MAKRTQLNISYRKGLSIAALLVALPAMAALETFRTPVASHDVASEIQMVQARELLGSDSIQVSAASQRRADFVNEFVRKYTEQSLRGRWKKQSRRVADTILKESIHYGFDPLLILAVIKNESGFKPLVVGEYGEIGLMQLKPDTAEWIAAKSDIKWAGEKTLRDPVSNIRLGTAYLAMLRAKFGSNRDLYLAAYNMGVSNVNRALSSNLVPRKYSNKTINHYSKIYTEFLKKVVEMEESQKAFASI